MFIMNKQILNKDEFITFSIRINKDTDKKVIDYAREHKWSRNFAIGEILEQFLSCQQS